MMKNFASEYSFFIVGYFSIDSTFQALYDVDEFNRIPAIIILYHKRNRTVIYLPQQYDVFLEEGNWCFCGGDLF